MKIRRFDVIRHPTKEQQERALEFFEVALATFNKPDKMWAEVSPHRLYREGPPENEKTAQFLWNIVRVLKIDLDQMRLEDLDKEAGEQQ